jgi:hypothetical protein
VHQQSPDAVPRPWSETRKVAEMKGIIIKGGKLAQGHVSRVVTKKNQSCNGRNFSGQKVESHNRYSIARDTYRCWEQIGERRLPILFGKQS